MRAKFIYEKFVEDSDPIKDLGIGLRSQIEKWIEEYKLDYTRAYVKEAKFEINDDLSIDLDGCLNLFDLDLEKLPDYIQFNRVTSNVWMNRNRLITLKGSPRWVGGNFFCCDNKLKSLKYAPSYVGSKFDCMNNAKKFTEEYVKKYVNAKAIRV